MNLIHVGLLRLRVLGYFDRDTHDNVQRAAIGHDANIIIKYPASMEQRHGKAKSFLDDHLKFVDQRMPVSLELVVELVFAKCEHGNEISAGADGELDKTFATLEDETEKMRLGVKGLAGTADHDGDGTAHPFVVRSAGGEDFFT